MYEGQSIEFSIPKQLIGGYLPYDQEAITTIIKLGAHIRLQDETITRKRMSLLTLGTSHYLWDYRAHSVMFIRVENRVWCRKREPYGSFPFLNSQGIDNLASYWLSWKLN